MLIHHNVQNVEVHSIQQSNVMSKYASLVEKNGIHHLIVLPNFTIRKRLNGRSPMIDMQHVENQWLIEF